MVSLALMLLSTIYVPGWTVNVGLQYAYLQYNWVWQLWSVPATPDLSWYFYLVFDWSRIGLVWGWIGITASLLMSPLGRFRDWTLSSACQKQREQL